MGPVGLYVRVYAYEDPDLRTPWPVPPGAKTLAECFVSSDGRDVLRVLDEALDMSKRSAPTSRSSPSTGRAPTRSS